MKYLYVDTDVLLRQFKRGNEFGILSILECEGSRQPRFSQTTFRLNDSAVSILLACDGTRTIDQVAELLSDGQESNGETLEKTKAFIDLLQKQYEIRFGEQEKPIHRPITSIGFGEGIYPSQITLEVTSRCNHRCLHCYGDYGKGEDAPLWGISRLLDSMVELGIMSMEISGGEPSIHPEIATIVKMAFEKGISGLSFLTNGYHLSNELLDALDANKSRLTVQVDLHSLDPAYYEWFTGVKDSLEHVQRTIKKLISRGIRTYIACNATPRNINEVEKIAEWARSMNASGFRLAPVVNVGRAISKEGVLFTEVEGIERFFDVLNRLSELYPDWVRSNPSRTDSPSNCGIVSDHCVISPTGAVKFCGMQSENDFHFSMGNAFVDSLASIYDRNRALVGEIMEMRSPQPLEQPCEDCEYRMHCANCLCRGLSMANKLKDKCAWYREVVPEVVKSSLMMQQ